ncbi:MAG TPA: cytochrome c peroxidase [Polyangiaceae bacterium]|nr:cytochrome c peroxidase [Polyangiaceae bacterium]
MRAPRAALSCLLVSLAGLACSKKETPAPAASASAPLVASAAAPAGPKTDSMTFPVLGSVPIPENNAQTPEKIALGHQLFFDKRLSADGTRACYSCHLNEDGTGGHDPTAVGAKGVKLTRHSPVLWNVGYLPRLYWDGRADSLESQALAAWAGGNMGVGKDKLEAKAKEIGKIPEYKQAFAKVFPDRGATPETIVQAISAYERTLVCDDTRYDRYAKGDKSALGDREKQGLELFMGKAGCVACHAPPHFSTAFMAKDGTYFNTGIGTRGKKEDEVDVGRMAVTKNAADWAAFKPPSLRNVAKTPPYFHDGSVADLEEAVRFMATGGHANKNLSPLLTDRKLTDAEISAVVAFLRSLDCPGSLVEPKLP